MSDFNFDLSLEGFLARIKEAVANKKLAIQHDDGIRRFAMSQPSQACMNVYPEHFFGNKKCHCIVGAIIPPELAERALLEPASWMVSQLNKAAFPTGTGIDQLTSNLLQSLQDEHDDLLNSQSITTLVNSYDAETSASRRWKAHRDQFVSDLECLTVERVKQRLNSRGYRCA